MSDLRDLSREEQAVLAGARRALEPHAQDAARVLHKARLAIASGAVPSAEAAASISSGAIGALSKHVAFGLAIAGISAWLGYGAGLRAGERAGRQAPVEMSAPEVAVRPALATPAEPVAPAQPLVPPDVEPATTAQQPPKKLKLAPAPGREVTASSDTEALAPEPSPSLEAEIKALRAVERALRNREPQRALELLAALDRKVQDGQLLEERAAARAMAQCEARATDRADAMQRVLEFSQAYPASVYFARVRTTCLSTNERDPETDSPLR